MLIYRWEKEKRKKETRKSTDIFKVTDIKAKVELELKGFDSHVFSLLYMVLFNKVLVLEFSFY